MSSDELGYLAREIAESAILRRALWLILKSNDGYTLEKSDIENYPGDDRAIIGRMNHRDGSVTLAASVRDA